MTQALSDVRVIEIGEMVSAPYAAKMLADVGAEVIKVERPREGDRARRMGPFPLGGADPEQSGLFLYLNANKLGITLDIAQPAGFEILEQLVVQADILIHNVPPPAMDRIGLGFERLRKVNPSLIMTSVSPFGLHGPYRNYLAEDLTIWNAGGACYINGAGTSDPDVPPLKTFGHPASYAGGVHAAVATMGAVIARDFSGEGEHVEVAIQDVTAATGFGVMFWPFMHTIMTRLGEKVVQPLEAMEAKDGWIFIEAVEEHQWNEFVELMGKPSWALEPIFATRQLRAANWDVLQPLLQQWVKQQRVLDLCKRAQEQRIPFAPVSTMRDLLESEHLQAREFFVDLAHPVAGRLSYPGAPAKFLVTPWQARCAAPTLGQHNQEIFQGRLGYAAAALAELRGRGVI
ncbi:MAG TPA: CoA transferase [Candidatus Binatia bacterium]|nr:CoA transferase [Candidatus Binatia bacterium]